jgi:hypothetical protein
MGFRIFFMESIEKLLLLIVSTFPLTFYRNINNVQFLLFIPFTLVSKLNYFYLFSF